MSELIPFCNDWAVGLFGSVLAAYFCSALTTRRNKWIFWVSMTLIPVLQSWVYYLWDGSFLRKIYPLLVHLPLFLVLLFLTRRALWPLISIFTAYLCCQLRRWIALFVIQLLGGGELMRCSVELLVTLPLLLALLKWAAPTIAHLGNYPTKTQCLFGSVPVMYYAFDYLTRVYSDILIRGEPVAVEFMPFLCCVAYLVFLLHYSKVERDKIQAEQVQNNMSMQLAQAVRQIDAMRESQDLASRYRHDLRHHLQYVLNCIENDQEDEAKKYISTICEEIEAQRVQRYCENDAVNLILSAFVGQAKKAGVTMQVLGYLSDFILASDSDLCVLLSNALENALHACAPLVEAGQDCVIDVNFHERGKKFFLQITNPCQQEKVRLVKGIPVTDQPGHGLGVQSICSVVAKYGGLYDFSVQDGTFILRLSL